MPIDSTNVIPISNGLSATTGGKKKMSDSTMSTNACRANREGKSLGLE